MYGIRIRAMQKEDAAQVSMIEREIFSQPWSMQGFLDALKLENVIFLVAAGEKDSEIKGYCGMYCASDEGEITNVAVRPDCRNLGIGRRMVKALLDRGETAGVKTAVLEVRASNEPAVRLYEQLGFQNRGLRRNFYQNPLEDGIVMMRSQ